MIDGVLQYEHDWQNSRSTRQATPARTLFAVVLQRAIDDWRGWHRLIEHLEKEFSAAKTSIQRRRLHQTLTLWRERHAEVERYLFDPKAEVHPMSFSEVCLVLDIDPAIVRKALKQKAVRDAA